jgi:hypothetical protein
MNSEYVAHSSHVGEMIRLARATGARMDGAAIITDDPATAEREAAGTALTQEDMSRLVAMARAAAGASPVAAGGAMPGPGFVAAADMVNPIAYPLGPPTMSGTDLTVDVMLQQPTRVTAFLMDLTLARFLLDRLFSSAGGVTGGAVVYDVIVANDIFLLRDVEPVAPGTEFPTVTSIRRVPKVATVEKFGGRFWTSYEARDRNDQVAFRNELTRLGNTIVRKLNQLAITAVTNAVAANGGMSNYVGNNWETAIPKGANPTPPPLTPGADFSKPQMLADIAELGIQFNVMLVNPAQLNSLRLFYDDGLERMLSDMGYDELYASNRVPTGSSFAVAEGQLGELRVEQPLQTQTWNEPERERIWTQSSVRPVMYVQNPFAVMQISGV